MIRLIRLVRLIRLSKLIRLIRFSKLNRLIRLIAIIGMGAFLVEFFMKIGDKVTLFFPEKKGKFFPLSLLSRNKIEFKMTEIEIKK